MKGTKLLALLLAILMVAAVFAACTQAPSPDKTQTPQDSGPPPDDTGDGEKESTTPEEDVEVPDLGLSEEKTTITHWTGFSGSDRPYLEKLAKDFNASDKEGQISMSIMSWSVQAQKLATVFASDTGPDFIAGDNQTNIWYQNYGCDMTPAYDDGRLDMSVYPTVVKDSIQFEGGIWTTPMATYGTALFYNVDKLAEAGWTTPPTTVDDLIQAGKDCTKLDDKGNVEQFGLSLSHEFFFTYFIWEEGFDVIDITRDGKATINEPGVAELLDQVSGYIRNDQVGPVIPDDAVMFTSEKLAMFVGGPWFSTQFEQAGINFDVTQLSGATVGETANFIPLKFLAEDQKKFDTFVRWSQFWLEEDNQVYWCSGSGYPLLRTDMDISSIEGTWAAKFTDAKDARRIKWLESIPGVVYETYDQRMKEIWQGACYGNYKSTEEYQSALDELAQEIDDDVATVGYTYDG